MRIPAMVTCVILLGGLMAMPVMAAENLVVHDPGILRAMSFNIRYGSAGDGSNSWEHRKELVADTISQYKPDIVGLQECLLIQAEYLATQLPEYHWYGVGREADGGGEYSAVLYKKETFSPVRAGTFWLSETPNKPGSKSWDASNVRIVSWVLFHEPASDRFFYHYNTHFDHRSAKARTEAAKLLRDHIAKRNPAYPVIVTGDFNAPAEQSEPWEILTGSGLSDAWLEAAEQIGPTQTFGGFGPPSEDDDRRIDWILFQGDFAVKKCETVLYHKQGRYPSDHYPIFAAFILDPAE